MSGLPGTTPGHPTCLSGPSLAVIRSGKATRRAACARPLDDDLEFATIPVGRAGDSWRDDAERLDHGTLPILLWTVRPSTESSVAGLATVVPGFGRFRHCVLVALQRVDQRRAVMAHADVFA